MKRPSHFTSREDETVENEDTFDVKGKCKYPRSKLSTNTLFGKGYDSGLPRRGRAGYAGAWISIFCSMRLLQDGSSMENQLSKGAKHYRTKLNVPHFLRRYTHNTPMHTPEFVAWSKTRTHPRPERSGYVERDTAKKARGR